MTEQQVTTIYDEKVEPTTEQVEQTTQNTESTTEQTTETTADNGKEIEITEEMIESKYGFKPSSFEELKKERDELINANPYKSNEAKQIDDLISGGMTFDKALEFIKLDASNLSAMQKIMLHQKQIIKGDFSDEELTNYINNDLLGIEDEFDGEPKLTIKQQARLQELEKQADEFIEEKKTSIKTEAPTRSSILEQRENIKRVEGWNNPLSKIAQPKMEFNFGDKENPLNIKLDISEADQKEIQASLKEHIENSDYSATNAEHVDLMKKYAKNLVILKNHDKLLDLAFKQGLSKKTKEMIQNEENPNFGANRHVASKDGQVITIH